MELGEVERRIVAELRKDARLSMRELAALVGVSTPTASAKVKQLEAMGLIRGYHAEIDPAMLAGDAHVLEVEPAPGETALVLAGLASIEGVADVVATEGGRLFARHQGATDALVRSLSRLTGVRGYKVHSIVPASPSAPHQPKPQPSPADAPPPAPSPSPSLRLNVPCHECGGPILGAGVHKRFDEDGRREHWFCCGNCATQFGARLQTLSRKVDPSRG